MAAQKAFVLAHPSSGGNIVESYETELLRAEKTPNQIKLHLRVLLSIGIDLFGPELVVPKNSSVEDFPRERCCYNNCEPAQNMGAWCTSFVRRCACLFIKIKL